MPLPQELHRRVRSSSSSSMTVTSRSAPSSAYPGFGPPPVPVDTYPGAREPLRTARPGYIQALHQNGSDSSVIAMSFPPSPPELPTPPPVTTHHDPRDSTLTAGTSGPVLRSRSSARISGPKGPRTSVLANGSSHFRNSVTSEDIVYSSDKDDTPIPSGAPLSDRPQAAVGQIALEASGSPPSGQASPAYTIRPGMLDGRDSRPNIPSSPPQPTHRPPSWTPGRPLPRHTSFTNESSHFRSPATNDDWVHLTDNYEAPTPNGVSLSDSSRATTSPPPTEAPNNPSSAQASPAYMIRPGNLDGYDPRPNVPSPPPQPTTQRPPSWTPDRPLPQPPSTQQTWAIAPPPLLPSPSHADYTSPSARSSAASVATVRPGGASAPNLSSGSLYPPSSLDSSTITIRPGNPSPPPHTSNGAAMASQHIGMLPPALPNAPLAPHRSAGSSTTIRPGRTPSPPFVGSTSTIRPRPPSPPPHFHSGSGATVRPSRGFSLTDTSDRHPAAQTYVLHLGDLPSQDLMMSGSSSSARTIRPGDATASPAYTITPRNYEQAYEASRILTAVSSSYVPSPTPTVTAIPRRRASASVPSPGSTTSPSPPSGYIPSPTPTVTSIPNRTSMDLSGQARHPVPGDSQATVRASQAHIQLSSQSPPRSLPNLPGQSRRFSAAGSNASTAVSGSRVPVTHTAISPVPEYAEPFASLQEPLHAHSHENPPAQIIPPAHALPPELHPQRLNANISPPPSGPFRRMSHLRAFSEAPDKKHRKKWTMEEIQMLAVACSAWGVGNWDDMIHDPSLNFVGRTPTDLEERFRKSFPDTYKEYYPSTKTSIFDRVKSALPSLRKLVPGRKKSLPTEVNGRQDSPNVTPVAVPKESLPQQSASERILQLTSKALETEDYSKILNLPNEDALLALNLIQKMLENRSSDSLNADAEAAIRFPRSQLRRLILELCLKCQEVPKALFLTDVHRTEPESRAAGGFADIYRGTWDGRDVALKCLRIFVLSPESQKAKIRQAFYRESLLWRNLQHKHVLPFFGVTGDVFPHTLCMVLPWMEHGNIRQYMHHLRESGQLVGQAFVNSVNKWLYEVGLGLAHLHSEEVVHGDLRGANILIDFDGCVRLADFGLAVTAQLTGSDYGKVFTHGGATRWQAPELLDPERFGSWSDLPTYSSDVYAFGSVCLELYTCQSPFSGLSDPQVYSLVLNGERPARPTADAGEAMSDTLWNLATWCWSDNPSNRPSADQVLETILSSTGGVMSPHIGEPVSPIPLHSRHSASSDELLVVLRLQGVERLNNVPQIGGHSADIFIGRYQGRKVALRRFRMFLRIEGERKLHEMLYSSALKWKDLQHKHILPFFGIDVTVFERGISMVFPWMTLGNLRNFITRLKVGNVFSNGSSWINRWIIQISKGLAYLHSEQVTHGALRGTNILIDEEWGVRLADYDQASILMQLGENTSSRASSAHRVLRWMPPEICEGAGITTMTDIYGFACVCLELYTCQDPFVEVKNESRFIRLLAAGSLKPIRPRMYDGALAEIPDKLWDILEMCWKHDPELRPTAPRLVQALTS